MSDSRARNRGRLAGSLTRDARTLWALVRPRPPIGTLGARLDQFYASQAGNYDHFRERLLQGRRELIDALPVTPGAVWVDLGGGTARTLEFLGSRLSALGHVHVVDLSTALLDVARARVRASGWTNVSLHQVDAGAAPVPLASADVVLFSYSLTMMPEWFRAIDHAHALLKQGELVASIDFYVSRKQAAPLAQHGALTRWLTRAWFSHSNVFVNADHVPYLAHRFHQVSLVERTSRLPYLPGARVPYYRFVGRR
jgi:S-adenosylmethionine-diacylgycerolhomoserine-N-methlytransferase